MCYKICYPTVGKTKVLAYLPSKIAIKPICNCSGNENTCRSSCSPPTINVEGWWVTKDIRMLVSSNAGFHTMTTKIYNQFKTLCNSKYSRAAQSSSDHQCATSITSSKFSKLYKHKHKTNFNQANQLANWPRTHESHKQKSEIQRSTGLYDLN